MTPPASAPRPTNPRDAAADTAGKAPLREKRRESGVLALAAVEEQLLLQGEGEGEVEWKSVAILSVFHTEFHSASLPAGRGGRVTTHCCRG